MKCSIIITTRNRANSLAKTLKSLMELRVPTGLECEILVVDNASTDNTEGIVNEFTRSRIPVRYALESGVGQSRARNTGIAQTNSDAVLFTDDDVQFQSNWLELMSAPLLNRECDAIGGPLRLPPELRRAWQTENYWGGIAAYEGPKNEPQVLVGANMGCHRSVFEKVPAFDVEIGPGALGFFDDTLFGMQLAESGFRLKFIPEAAILHYADASRLLRRHCILERIRYGSSLAYVSHHWRHETWPKARRRYCLLALKLALRRTAQPPQPLNSEGMPPWEVSYVAEMAMCRQYFMERKRPRNYSKFGTRKLR